MAKAKGQMFVAGILIKGEDQAGILNNISNVISTYKSTNIKSLVINSTDSTFICNIGVMVEDVDHLNKLIERLKKVKGAYLVERIQNMN